MDRKHPPQDADSRAKLKTNKRGNRIGVESIGTIGRNGIVRRKNSKDGQADRKYAMLDHDSPTSNETSSNSMSKTRRELNLRLVSECKSRMRDSMMFSNLGDRSLKENSATVSKDVPELDRPGRHLARW